MGRNKLTAERRAYQTEWARRHRDARRHLINFNTVLRQQRRFFAHVETSDKTDCWLWTGRKNRKGYGIFHFSIPRLGTKGQLAHRFVYLNYVGPIPDGLTIDHLCRVRNCVNPFHLEPVTIRENVQRGYAARGYGRTA